MNSIILESAKKTILAEANAISQLAEYLNSDFEEVVQYLHSTTGRIVVSGIGKSAIIAQKIVATFNSTGTPALFMHAADAIHGDLGMIQENDSVIIISKSGESPEIKYLIPIIKNFKNKIIAIVGNTNSYLATNAHYVLNTTVSEEACPNNLAPTTSTTAQMVMGDALAICLMQLSAFTNKDFAKYHPGGNLGKKLYLRVEDLIANNEIPKVLPTAGLKEVIIEITGKRLGVTAVTNAANTILGIITDGDLRRMLEHTNQISNITALDICTKQPKQIEKEAMAIEALEMMKQYDITQLLVHENNQFVGVLHIHDLMREGIL